MSFFTGTKGGWEQRPWAPGAQEAFGQAGNYYRDLLSDDSQNFNAMAAPETRQFNQQIIPGLSEQFAGMGSGALSSSGFRNAAVGAGTDLSERLGAIRAQLRQQGAQGLQSLGQQYQDQQFYRQGQPGLLDSIGPALGSALGSFAGPIGTAVGGALGSGVSNWFSNKGKSSPYGPGMAKPGGGVLQSDASQGYNPASFMRGF